MVEPQLILFAVDGVLTQCELARATMQATDYPTMAIDAVVASLVTLRALLVTQAEQGPDDGSCRHPVDHQHSMQTPQGPLITCDLCNEIISQPEG